MVLLLVHRGWCDAVRKLSLDIIMELLAALQAEDGKPITYPDILRRIKAV